MDCRFRRRSALILILPGELNDQDGIFSSKPNQHDKANLGQDVDRHASEM